MLESPLRLVSPRGLRRIRSSLLACAGLAAILSGAGNLHGAYSGPVPAPTDTYGQAGTFSVTVRTFPSPDWPGQVVTVFVPTGSGPRPTWFFAPGYGFNDPAIYSSLLNHLASHGWTVVFSPYPTGVADSVSYATLFDGFTRAAALYPDAIDTRKVGFAGHSFGASAVPGLSLKAVRTLGWGAEGLCLFVLAPAFVEQVSDADLQSFPASAQIVIEVYEDDMINDHRMAIDLYRSLSVPAANKNYLLVHSDQVDGFGYLADHLTSVVPGSPVLNGLKVGDNALGAWAVNRIAAALSASTFGGDPAARAIALGAGSAAQTQMGIASDGRPLRPMTESSEPFPLFPQDRYGNKFGNPFNPRVNRPPPESSAAPSRLANISARAYASSGAQTLIVGAVLEGSQPKNLLIRAVGPGLIPFNVSGTMADPSLVTFRGSSADVSNRTWSAAWNLPALEAASGEVGAFSLAGASADSALLVDFDPGALTAQVQAAAGGPGVVLLELFDADLGTASSLINLSARAYVGTGPQVLIAGFVIKGTSSATVLIRGVGPALEPFNVSGALASPELVLFDASSTAVATNVAWGTQPTLGGSSVPAVVQPATSAVFGQVSAFALPEGSADCAMVATLPPGAYTAQVSGAGGTTGVALVEVYLLP